jgi:hypothetical protein
MDFSDENPPVPALCSNLCYICSAPSLLRCSRCKDAQYCGEWYQKKAWPTHQKIWVKVEVLHDAEKTAYAEMLEERLQNRMIKIAYHDRCILIEIAATLALNQFRARKSLAMINRDPLKGRREASDRCQD